MAPRDDAAARSVRRYRDRMKRAGLRLVQLWVPDTRARGFTQECERQCQAAASAASHEVRTQAWLDKTRDTDGWTA